MARFEYSEIVSERENHPSYSPRKTRFRTSAAPKFCDAVYWDELAAKHLPRHDLPAWGAPCDPEAMGQWLDRLRLTERDYLKATATSLQEFVALNPKWDLRAWLGTVLELVEHEGKRRASG